MSCDSNGLCPATYRRLYTIQKNGGTEDSSVKHGSYCTIGALPHFCEVILFHSLGIGCDCCTLYRNTILLIGICCIPCYLILCLFSFGKSKVIIFCLEVNKRKNKLILYHLPENSCHFIPVHFDKGGCHSNLFHSYFSFAEK